MSQEKLFKNFIAPVLIETTIIFVILTISLLLEFYSRDLLMVEIIRPVTGRAIQTALGFAFFYRLFRSGASNILWMLSIIIKPEQEKTMDKYDYLQDVFITLCIILTTTPVRPILQTARIDGSELFFEQGFARFDSFESILILIAVSIPLLIHIFISKQGKERTIPVILIIIAISTVGFINSKPNYLARIYESRAGWVTDDQDKQRASGLQALEDAETAQEKTVQLNIKS